MNALKILEERGFIEQLTHPKEMYELFDRNESVPFYIGIDPTADSLHVGHFVSLMVASYLQIYFSISIYRCNIFFYFIIC